jgi:hypothetical protein
MLDLPGHPVLDKASLVGACLRLPLRIDGERLRAEVAALEPSTWGTRGGRIGLHSAAEALFLRGHAPAQGDLPMENRPALALLPYARELIEQLIPAPPLRCLLARLPAQAVISPHTDYAPYFSKSLRLHFAVETTEQAWMLCAGQAYVMRLGEVWVLNNSTEHAVWNAHPTQFRTHMICDYLPSPQLLELLAAGDRTLGRVLPELESHVGSATGPNVMASG